MPEEHACQRDLRDYLGGNLIWIGYTYRIVKDALPPKALAAFEAGIRKHVERISRWGPKGLMTDMDLFAPVGLHYIVEGTTDEGLKRVAENYSRRLFTEPEYFHAAGRGLRPRPAVDREAGEVG